MQQEKFTLITGGAGYIGSAIATQLHIAKHNIIIIDRNPLTKSLKRFLNNITFLFFQADIADTTILRDIFTQYTIETVIHCAALIEVGLSVKDPQAFYENNVTKTLTLLNTMLQHGCKKIIFSSSCAVFGVPTTPTLAESHSTKPISPYGHTKLIVELIVKDYVHAYELSAVILRYFNAAGAWDAYDIGECHEPETHLIPLLIKGIQEDKPCTIFGNQHKTADGTCVRDYLHVQDIADAHEKAYHYLQAHNTGFYDFNLGTGNGHSILEVIKTLEQICGEKISIIYGPARAGDPAYLVANPTQANTELGWHPQHSDITTILRSAYQFHQKNKRGC